MVNISQSLEFGFWAEQSTDWEVFPGMPPAITLSQATSCPNHQEANVTKEEAEKEQDHLRNTAWKARVCNAGFTIKPAPGSWAG